MQKEETDCTRKIPVTYLSRWLPYQVNRDPFFGACIDTLDENKLLFCLTSLKGCPFLVEFDAYDIKNQASQQGFVFKTLRDVTDQVFAFLKEPSEELHFDHNGKRITFKIAVSRELCLRLESPTSPIDKSQWSAIFQSISSSFFDNQVLLKDIVDDLQGIISRKDQGLTFLMDSLRDVGFDSLQNKWAPRGSFNYDSLQSFDFDEWFNKWPSSAKNVRGGGRGGKIPEVYKLIRLLGTKPPSGSQSNVSASPRAQTRVLSSGDEFASLSFVEDEHNETHLSEEAELADSREKGNHTCGQIKGTATPVEFEGCSNQIHLSDVPVLSPKKAEPFSTSSKQPSPTPEDQMQSLQEHPEDRSPSRKRRKFGKLRIE
ncbi:LAQU0S03e08482g1_1 [Lachancea quebecensis]|uniref:LAQU0S03e08482g1_1 n=1 Tax=Lachancea quebecensis TaxID=1654605 RepID=A0A0P1KQ37_9SACH|nr:LAQU0S03e08482g1_1 [Lachancea quebecensis]